MDPHLLVRSATDGEMCVLTAAKATDGGRAGLSSLCSILREPLLQDCFPASGDFVHLGLCPCHLYLVSSIGFPLDVSPCVQTSPF